jgi:hypothetical protein
MRPLNKESVGAYAWLSCAPWSNNGRMAVARGSRSRAGVGLPATCPREHRASAEYQRCRPETTVLYEIVRDNIDTLYGAIDDSALDISSPKHAIKELDAYLNCGLLCRGFARVCGFRENYQMLFTFGQPTTNQGKTTSPGNRLNGGLVGANGSLP